jgi:hypothetical protein
MALCCTITTQTPPLASPTANSASGGIRLISRADGRQYCRREMSASVCLDPVYFCMIMNITCPCPIFLLFALGTIFIVLASYEPHCFLVAWEYNVEYQAVCCRIIELKKNLCCRQCFATARPASVMPTRCCRTGSVRQVNRRNLYTRISRPGSLLSVIMTRRILPRIEAWFCIIVMM